MLVRAVLASVVLTNIITEPVMAQSLEVPQVPTISSVTENTNGDQEQNLEPGTVEAAQQAEEQVAQEKDPEQTQSGSDAVPSPDDDNTAVQEAEVETSDNPEGSGSAVQLEPESNEDVSEEAVPTEEVAGEESPAEEEVVEQEPEEIEASLISLGSVSQPTQTYPAFTVQKTAEIQSVQELQERLRITLVHPDGGTVLPSFDVTETQGEYTVTVLPEDSFVPGNYGIKAVIDGTRGSSRKLQSLFRATEGEVEDITVLDTTVQWGTIVANTDRTSYAQGDTVLVSVSALSDFGNPLCSAAITVKLTDPSGVTGNPTHMQSPATCIASSLPVFTAAIPVSDVGVHTIAIEAETAEGMRYGVLTVDVTEQEPILNVQRIGSTAVGSGSEGEMSVIFTPSHTFVGSLTEKIPSGIHILSTAPEAQTVGSVLEWKKQWNAGQEYVLKYVYRIPDEGSHVWLLGPLEAEGTVEASAVSVPVSGEESSSSSAPTEPEKIEEEVEQEEAVQSSSSQPADSGLSEENSDEDPQPSAEEEVLPTPDEKEEVDDESNGPLSSIINDILRFFVPEAVAQNTPDRELRFRELRRWQMLSAATVVGKLQDVEEDDSAFEFVDEKNTADLPTKDNEIALDYAEGTDAVAMGEEPKFVLVKPKGKKTETSSEQGTVLEEKEAAKNILDAVLDEDDIGTVLTEGIVNTSVMEQGITKEVLTDTLRAGVLKDALLPEGARMRASTLNAVEDEVVRRLTADETDETEIVEKAKDIVLAAMDDATVQKAKESVVQSLADGETDKKKVQDAALQTVDTEKVSVVTDAIVKDKQVQDSAFTAMAQQGTAGMEEEKSEELITVTVTDSDGNVVDSSYHFEEKGEETVLVIEKETTLKPGTYTVSATVRNPVSGEEKTQTKNFTWGVLAINPGRDVYRPDDIANIAIGVLNDAGEMVCDASVVLTVKSPNGSTFTLSTDDGSIAVSQTCDQYIAGLIDPDYETFFRVSDAGTYDLTLTATTQNGTHKVTSKIVVESAPEFSIERTAATRLWPAAVSPMTIEITSLSAFAGTVTDTLPLGFVVTDVGQGGRVVQTDEGVTVVWQASWQAGEKAQFTYEYDAPDVSPEFYLVGPLQLSASSGDSYTEKRTWQIANDPVVTIGGRVYLTKGANDIGANKTVQIVVNGVAGTTDETDANGNYSFSSITVTGGTVIAVYLTGEAEKGATVTVASGITISNLDIYKNYLIVRSESGTVITNGILDTAHDGNAQLDTIYTVDSNVVNVKAGKNLFLWKNTTYKPYANVNVGSGIILEGTFNPGTSTVTLSGSWMNTSTGTFINSGSTVVLDGVNQTMSGDTVFYNLYKVAKVRDTLTLAVGMRQAATGSLILKGATGAVMEVRSSHSGSLARLVLFGYSNAFQDITNLRVRDNSATGSVVNRAQALNCTKQCGDRGNNHNWTFASPIITGSLYSDEGTTPIASATVAMSVNGGSLAEQVAVDAGGQFSLSGAVMTGGTLITLFVNGSSDHAVTIVLGSGSAMTGVHLYENRLILRSESGSAAVTNAHIAVADDRAGTADTDITNIISAASPSALTVASAKEILVWADTTFRPGGTVVTHDMDINGTLNYQDNSLGITGSWDATGGTASGNDVTSFTSTGSETILSAGNSFNNIVFNGAGGTWTLQDATDVNGTFTLSQGTFEQNGQNLTISGNVLITNGANFNAPLDSGTITLDGDLTFEDETGTKFGMVQIGASPDVITLSGSLHANKVTIGTGDTLVLSGHNLYVGTGGLFIHGLLDAGDNGTDNSVITVSGSWLATGTGDFIAGTSTVTFDGTSGTYDITASGSFYNLTFAAAGATYSASGTTLDVNGSMSLTAGTLTAPAGNITLSGAWTKAAAFTFAHNSGSVILDGDSQTISGSTVFYNFSKSVSSAQTLTFHSTSETSVSGALSLSGADTDNKLSLRTTNANISSLLTLDSGGSQSLTFLDVQRSNAGNGETLTCTDCTDSFNNTNWSFVTPTIVGTLYSDAGTTPLASKKVSVSFNGGAITDTDPTDAGGQFTLSGANMTGGTIITLYIQDETEDGITVVLGSGGSMTGINLYQDYLIVRSESGTTAVTNAILGLADDNGGTADTDLSNIYSVSAGALTVATGKQLLVWANDSFSPGGAVTVPQLTVGAGSTFTGNGAIDINGALTIQGTFVHGTSTLNVSGDVRVVSGGTFTKSSNGSLFTLDGDLTYEDEQGVNLGTVQIGASPDTTTLSGSMTVDKLTVGTGDV
ncbi:hypothetical protein CO157_05155, partial [Candidatus Peregrinibacteria bacterium CG_4_9_14_3_um_filter_49_12]